SHYLLLLKCCCVESTAYLHGIHLDAFIMHCAVALFFLVILRRPIRTLFPYTTLFRSRRHQGGENEQSGRQPSSCDSESYRGFLRSEEHTSELQSRVDLVGGLQLGEINQAECHSVES